MKKILVALDFSELTAPVLETAAMLTSALGATVYLAHVVRYSAGVIDMPVPLHLQTEALGRLYALRDDYKAKGTDAVVVLLETIGNPGYKILEEAEKLGVDLIVVGSHGHGAMYHLLIGSAAELLLRKARCPVVVVPPANSGKTKPTITSAAHAVS